MDEMKDCIDRKEAIRICERLRDKTDNEDMAFALNWAIQSINGIPAENVRPVVLCRDCKHYDNGWCHRVHNPAQYRKTTGDWFCADGEKRSGDGAT